MQNKYLSELMKTKLKKYKKCRVTECKLPAEINCNGYCWKHCGMNNLVSKSEF